MCIEDKRRDTRLCLQGIPQACRVGLQCVAVLCRSVVLHCGAVCCSVLQCVAVCCSVLQCVAVRCSVAQMQLRCSVLQCGVNAVCCLQGGPCLV